MQKHQVTYKKKCLWSLMILVLGIMLTACSSDGKVALKEVSIIEKNSQEAAVVTEKTTENTTDSETVATIEHKEPPVVSVETKGNYFYERIRGDRWKVFILGDLEVSEEDEKALNRILNNYQGEISLKVVSSDGSKGFSYNSEGEYFSACTVKAPYMLYCYRQMQQGNGTLKEEMVYDRSKHYHTGTGELKWNPHGTVYTLKELMYYTLWKSDNVGYMMCLDRFGKEGYNAMMDELCCPSLKIEDYAPWSFVARAEDLVIAWREIYDFLSENNEYSWAMYDSCTPCSYNFMGDAIPKYVISQKYGWGDDVYSDGGIVHSDNGDYIFAVYTNSSGEEYDKRVVNDAFRIIHKYMLPK